MPFFLSNIFLWFGLAALIPVALHLLHRQKPRPVFFAAMQFLQEAVAQTRRARRITQCLTLLFRMLLLILLALAFARPLVHWQKLLPQGRRTLILVLDSSAGMQALDGGVSRFEISRGAAREVLQGAGSGDRIALLAPGSSRPEVIFPPVSMQNLVREELSNLQPGWGRGELFSSLNEVLRRHRGHLDNAEIYLFSDFQKEDCPSGEASQLAEELQQQKAVLYLNMAGRPVPGENCALEEIQFLPPAILGDGAFKVRIRAVRNSAFQGTVLARLRIGGQEAGQQVLTAAAGAEGPVCNGEIAAPPSRYEPGNVTGSVELEPDSYAADHRYYFSLPHLQSQKAVLVYGEAPRDCFYLEKAMAPGGNATSLLQSSSLSWQDFLAGDFSSSDFLFLCNPPELGSAVQEKLKLCLRKGGTVLIFPGEALSSRTEQPVDMDFWPGLISSVHSYATEEKLSVIENDRRELLVRSIARTLPDPGSLLVRRRLKLQAGPGQSVPWIWEDGGAFALPAPLERGRLWLFSVSANRDWANWPVTPFFLILVQELIKKSAEEAGLLYQGEIGVPFRFSWPSEELRCRLELRNPRGIRRMIALERKNPGDFFWLPPLHLPGIYELREGASEEKAVRFAVNIPPSEKNPVPLSSEELLKSLKGAEIHYSADSGELLQQISLRREGRPLWPVLLLLAWLLAIAEVLFANLRSRTKVTVHL